ncbi:MAG: thioredoxin-disulfide reductase [Candidatus Aenigmatarchaeota archaeon]
MTDYDIIIVGLGPAGLAAGIYAARRNLKVLVIGELLGGQMSWAHTVENYPGIEPMPGTELAQKMKSQAEKFGCEIKMEAVKGFELKDKVKKIKTSSKEYECKAVIFATGSHYRKLGAEGEKEFIGKGVSYCSTCDGPFFKGKRVAVIGGGNSAINAALYLNEIASETYIIHRKDQLTAEEASQKKLKETSVKIIWDSVVEKIEGDQVVKKIIIKNIKTNETSELELDGVFVEIGEIPTTDIVSVAGIEVNERNFIKVNENFETSIEGVYAAGDVTGSFAQIITAAAAGAEAATNAYLYLKGGVYGTKITFDYGEKKAKK